MCVRVLLTSFLLLFVLIVVFDVDVFIQNANK